LKGRIGKVRRLGVGYRACCERYMFSGTMVELNFDEFILVIREQEVRESEMAEMVDVRGL